MPKMTSTYIPPWKTHEKNLSSNNLDTAMKATEAFDSERTLELKTSKRAREWEKDRKTSIMKEKPKWSRERREKDVAPLKQLAKELKQGAEFQTGIKPMPGFVLIKPEIKEQTDSGIFLTTNDANLMNSNKGTILSIGGEIVHYAKVVQPPAKTGDLVMFKKGLPGLEMTVKGEFCLLMTWDDILAVVES